MNVKAKQAALAGQIETVLATWVTSGLPADAEIERQIEGWQREADAIAPAMKTLLDEAHAAFGGKATVKASVNPLDLLREAVQALRAEAAPEAKPLTSDQEQSVKAMAFVGVTEKATPREALMGEAAFLLRDAAQTVSALALKPGNPAAIPTIEEVIAFCKDAESGLASDSLAYLKRAYPLLENLKRGARTSASDEGHWYGLIHQAQRWITSALSTLNAQIAHAGKSAKTLRAIEPAPMARTAAEHVNHAMNELALALVRVIAQPTALRAYRVYQMAESIFQNAGEYAHFLKPVVDILSAQVLGEDAQPPAVFGNTARHAKRVLQEAHMRFLQKTGEGKSAKAPGGDYGSNTPKEAQALRAADRVWQYMNGMIKQDAQNWSLDELYGLYRAANSITTNYQPMTGLPQWTAVIVALEKAQNDFRADNFIGAKGSIASAMLMIRRWQQRVQDNSVNLRSAKAPNGITVALRNIQVSE